MMSEHRRALCALCTTVLLVLGHSARVIDKGEPSHQAKTPHHKAVQAADSHRRVSPKKSTANVVKLEWKPVPEAQDAFALSFNEVPPPPDYVAQLAALASQNSVVQYFGRGYKNDVAIQLNGTVTISARDAWSPVLDDMKRVQPAIAATDAPTAYAYRGDLMCGIYSVGSCALTGQLLARQTIPPAWDSMVMAQCTLNSNAGVSCDWQFKKGMRVQAEGLAAVTVDSNGIIQKIDAMGLAVTSIYYSDGGSTSLLGGLLNAVSNTLQYTGGDLSIYVVSPTPEGSYSGNATFNLQKTLPAGSS